VASWSAIARRIRVPLGFGFAIVYVWLARPSVISLAVGAALMVPGLLVRGAASGHVQKNEELTTSGPYAYTRNPLYLGSFILALGAAVAARNWWIVAGMVVMFAAIYLPVIRSEEAYLREHFTQFAEYASAVPRLWPRLTAFRRGEEAFSWDLYRKHREYNATVGAVGIIAVLAAKMLWLSR
jgi:protein-S-isoprenylcysteine O-methyltransferase Ste14